MSSLEDATKQVIRIAREEMASISPRAAEIVDATAARLGEKVGEAAAMFYVLMVALMQFDLSNDELRMAHETAFSAAMTLAVMHGVPGEVTIALAKAYHGDGMDGGA